MNFFRCRHVWVLCAISTLTTTCGICSAHANTNTNDVCSRTYPLSASIEVCPIAIDDDTAPRSGGWSPWTFRPYCVQPENKPKDSPKYCAFTNIDFRAGQGIGVITTPYLAASLVVALDDSIVPLKLQQHPSSPLSFVEEEDIPYVIQDLPDRGKGTIAQEKIPRWQTVMVDFPAVVAPIDLFEAVSPDQGRMLLMNAIDQLPHHQKWAIISLAASVGGGLVQDILGTNAFGVEVNGVLHMAVFPTGSRVNHACRPNVFWRYSPSTLTMEFVALRDIEPGEEITYSYVPLGSTREERQNMLRGWGFNCTCDLCSASEDAIARSDNSRRKLEDIRRLLESDTHLNQARIARHAKEIQLLVNREELHPQMVVYYDVIARAYIGIGDFENARKYVALAEETWIQYGGHEHDGLEDMRLLRDELESRFKEQFYCTV